MELISQGACFLPSGGWLAKLRFTPLPLWRQFQLRDFLERVTRGPWHLYLSLSGELKRKKNSLPIYCKHHNLDHNQRRQAKLLEF